MTRPPVAREVTIRDWKPEVRNTLRGFFSVVLPSGLILHRCSLQESHGRRWIGLPAREWIGRDNKPAYAKLIEFVDQPTADRFRDLVLAAFDREIGGEVQRKPAQAELPVVRDADWEAL